MEKRSIEMLASDKNLSSSEQQILRNIIDKCSEYYAKYLPVVVKIKLSLIMENISEKKEQIREFLKKNAQDWSREMQIDFIMSTFGGSEVRVEKVSPEAIVDWCYVSK